MKFMMMKSLMREPTKGTQDTELLRDEHTNRQLVTSYGVFDVRIIKYACISWVTIHSLSTYYVQFSDSAHIDSALWFVRYRKIIIQKPRWRTRENPARTS